MKKGILIALCVLLFFAAVGGGLAFLLLTPRGSLRSDGPDAVMAQMLDDLDRSALREEFVRLCSPEVSEFEDAQAVAEHLFDMAVQRSSFTFRPVPGTEGSDSQDYIISCGDTDLLKARLRYSDGEWSGALCGLDALAAVSRTLEITVPEDAALTINGKPVGEEYIAQRDLLYPDMTGLELRFESFPRRVLYSIPGIYETASVEAERPGGLTLLYADGIRWEYTVPDAAGYAFCAAAPGEAIVTANGAELTGTELAEIRPYATRLEIPGELQGVLPSFSVYAAGGLYTRPEITAVMPDGTPLEAETLPDGSISFALPGSSELYESCHGRVEEYLKAMCEYGGGHTQYGPTMYTVAGTGISSYLQHAVASLYWTRGVSIRYDEISSGDYIPLGDSAFICRGHVVCTTKTGYETQDLDMHYEMLWIYTGSQWLLQDLVFTK